MVAMNTALTGRKKQVTVEKSKKRPGGGIRFEQEACGCGLELSKKVKYN